ncbi:MAG TPA: PD-(D/E)XK nuclease family protein [Desulfobacteria bacterium]|nr:PD-(D/E)XK nuclease family protein [Desulfobacteria bacterium]
MNVAVSDLSRLISGDEACLFKIWYKMRHKEATAQLSKSLVQWKINHTKMLKDLSNGLEKRGGRIKKEEYVKLDVSGGTLVGRVDLLHIADDEVVIYDCKGGRQSASHHVQMMIYLYMVDKLDLFEENPLRGVIHYEDANISYSLSDIYDDLPSEIGEYTNILMSDSPPSAFVGASCEWCNIECEEKEVL